RRSMTITPQEAYDMVVVQVGALAGVAASQGGRLQHVKTHGALYNMSAKNKELATAIAQAVYDVDASLVFYALASSAHVQPAHPVGLRVAQAVFADRTYQSDGTLTPRTQPGSMIEDADTSIRQVLRMVKEGKVATQHGDDA